LCPNNAFFADEAMGRRAFPERFLALGRCRNLPA
jgi:hypothetical protein